MAFEVSSCGLSDLFVVFNLGQLMNVSVINYIIQTVLGTSMYALIVWLLKAPIIADIKSIIRLRKKIRNLKLVLLK